MRIGVLGPIEVLGADEPLHIGGPQQRRLLALLVVNREHAVSTDRIVDALWADGEAPEGAERSVRTYMSRLRSALPDAIIERDNSGYTLRLDPAGAALDVEEFEACLDEAARQPPDLALGTYERALGLWRGRPFGELADEWWALPDTTRLIERRHLAEEERAAALAIVGRHGDAVAELERLSRTLPHRERPVQLLMRSLSESGRRPEALRVARSFRRRLADETGLEPSSRFDELESAVVRGDETLDVGWPLRGYTLRRLLGRGPRGHVYAAAQPGTHRDVAIRVIDAAIADDPEFVRRFDAEARIMTAVEHPHVAAVLDHWREPGGAYLVTELLDRGSVLDSITATGGWDAARVGTLLDGLGDALDGLPPGAPPVGFDSGSLLLDADGRARITDLRVGMRSDDLPARAVALARLASEALGFGARAAGAHRPPDDPAERLAEVLDRAESGGFASTTDFLAAWRSALGPTVLSPSAPRTVANPYRGLRPFEEADAAFFHGRHEATDAVERRLDASGFVAVVGPSGAGKSSVVRAGLVPRLNERGTLTITMTPGDDAIESLGDAIDTIAVLPVGDDGGRSGSTTLSDQLRTTAAALGPLVVIVDQFEECWTRCTDDARDDFLAVLADMSDDVGIVVTLRSDFLDRPLEDRSIGRRVAAGTVVVGPMTAPQLRSAIERPAADVGVAFEPALVDELIAGVAGERGALPLLQFALTELFDDRDADTITSAGLGALGGIAGAIGRRAEEAFQTLGSDEQAEVRELFGRLVVPGEGVPDTRRRARRSELAPESVAIAEHFVAHRLLLVDRESGSREPTFEVAHEALFRSWPRLRRWIDEDRAWLLQRQQLDRAAQLWDDAGRPESDLYRGARLDAVDEALGAGRSVSERSSAFVQAGRRLREADEQAEQRRVRRLRATVALTSVLAAVAVALGVVAVAQRNDARRANDEAQAASAEAADEATAARAAESSAADARTQAEQEAEAARAAESSAAAARRTAQVEALVGTSRALRSTQRDVAALLAIEAHRLEPSVQTRSALFATFTDDERYLDTRRLSGAGGRSGIVVSGGAAYVTDETGRLHEYGLETGELGAALPMIGPSSVDRRSVVASSGDGALLLQATRVDQQVGPTAVGIVDLRTNQLEFEPVTVDAVVTSAAFLGDGRVALATGEDGAVIVIDVETGATVGEVPAVDIDPDDIVWTADPGSASVAQPLRRPSAVAFDGEVLVVGSADEWVRVVDPVDLTVLRTVRVREETASALATVDGTVVAAGRQGVSRVRLDDGTTMWEIEQLERCTRLLVAERSSVFCGASYGRVDELDLESGELRRRLDAQQGIRASLWLSADGTELVRFDDSEPIVSRWRLDGSGPVTQVTPVGYWPRDFDASGTRLLLARGGPRDPNYGAAIVDVDQPSALTPVDGLIHPGWSGDDELFGGAGGFDRGIEFVHADISGDATTITPTGVPVEDVGFVRGATLDTGKQRSLMRYVNDEGENWVFTVDPRTLERGARIDVTGLISWSADRSGERIVLGTPDGIAIHDSDTGELIHRIDGAGDLTAAVTSADQLLVGSLGGVITLYDLDTFEPLQVFTGGPGLMLAASGTADGSLVATTNGDGTASLHDTTSGRRLGDPIPMPNGEVSLSVYNVPRLNADGTMLAVTSGYDPDPDLDIRRTELWSLDPVEWIDAACALAGRNLTPEEWATHIGELAAYGPTCPDHGFDR